MYRTRAAFGLTDDKCTQWPETTKRITVFINYSWELVYFATLVDYRSMARECVLTYIEVAFN